MKSGLLTKKFFLIFIMIFFLLTVTSWVSTQEKEKIRLAVTDFTKESQNPDHENLEKIVPEWLTTFLVEAQAFEVIERRKLQKVLQEQNLGQTGIIETESAAQVGKILGVNILITGTVISVGDTLEVTIRLVDTTNGAIIGAASVSVDDVDDLRDQIKELAGIIKKKLFKRSIPEDVKVIDTFDEDEISPDLWEFEFDEKVKKADKDNTELSQEDDVLRITGAYQGEDENRYAWLAPNFDGPYQSIEIKIRVHEVKGVVGVCLGTDWNEERWTGICFYFEEDGYGDVTISSEDTGETEEEFDLDIQLNQWYVMRLEYKEAQFHYYWNDQLIKSITPKTPVNSLEELEWYLELSLEETKIMTIEVDEIILR
jgi:TolB-like protein